MNRGNRKVPFAFQLYKYIIIGIVVIIFIIYILQNTSSFYRKTFTLPFSMHLNKQDLYLIKGEEYRLRIFDFHKKVSYTTTNFRVVGVNFNGRVFAHQTGKAFIIARADGKELKCRIHVIDLNRESLEIKVGKSYRLKVKGSNAHIRWISSDKSVATVNMNGMVKAKNKGHTVIYAKIKGRKLKCSVWVR